MPAPTDTLLPARYRDAKPIARGGMGEIFLARDSELGREVVVKVLAARFSENADLRERFKREALAAARLSGNHNIVTIFDVGEHDGRPIIVMEYLAGGSLEQRIESKPCDTTQALDWLAEAAAALDAAHEAGIVHRDVKPGNLLLDDRGHVKVADFGIASAAGMDSFTQAGTVLGTAGYLSPEQARGERATAASDRYGLAVVAWELLTGRRPFQADSPTAEASAHVNAPIPSAHRANPELPAAFDAIFAKALAKDPADRYGDAAEFVGDLRSARHDAAGETQVGWVQPVPAATAQTRVSTQPGRRRLWLLALGVALVAGIAVAALLTSGGSTPKQAAQRTVVRTVTSPGQTVRQTVTVPTTAPTTTPPATTPPATAPAATAPTAPASGASGASLNDAGYAKMQAGDYPGALPLLEQAVQKLSGTGSTDEAYADYNLAYTRRALGQCTDVAALLDRSQAIQGSRKEIDRLRKDVEKRC